MDLPSREELREYLLRFDMFEQLGRPEEGRFYVDWHLDRLIKTLEIIPRLPGRVRALELGASPYFMSLLVMKYLGYETVPANFFGDYGEVAAGEDEVTFGSPRFGETHTFRFKIFNVEKDPFPYADGEFDIVLCCEILEHLISDPSHMLREIHRVLKPGGFVVISTPNLISLENAFLLLQSRSFLHAYSGYGVYGRHNREYTPRELHELLRLHNFAVSLVVEDVYPPHTFLHRWLTRIGPLRWRRDNIFAVAQAFGSPVRVYPEWLYGQQWIRRSQAGNTVVMGEGESSQLGPGWHGFEYWPPGVRWTSREAIVYLRPAGHERSISLRAHAGPWGAQGKVLVNGQRAGTFSLEGGKGGDIVLPLPEAVQQGIQEGTVQEIEVRLLQEKVSVPAQGNLGSRDRRELGLAIERLWLG
jgi:SAM-dependent methyltransferase